MHWDAVNISSKEPNSNLTKHNIKVDTISFYEANLYPFNVNPQALL